MRGGKLYWFVYSFFLVFLFMMSIHLYSWTRDGVVSNSLRDEILKNSSVQEKEFHYPYLDVDLTPSLSMNSNTVAWIQVEGTNINYPVVQTSNNEYYLNHSFSKEESSAGWVFLDSRNTLKDQRMILYAHNRLDGTMFGSLVNLLKEDNKNAYLYFNTKDEKMTFQIVSIYVLPESEFSNTLEVNLDFLQDILERNQSSIVSSATLSDVILTLYTCYGYGDERLVLNARRVQTI